MNNEKVKEIKDKLQEEVLIATSFGDKFRRVPTTDLQDFLTLINELESENERLSNTEIGELIKENEELAKQCVDWSELDFKKRNQIKQLKDRISELEMGIEALSFAVKQGFNDCQTKTLKQFATLLKVKTVLTPSGWCVNIEDIDETLKQFIKE